jgi:endonuclease/exonuclease/phosphatase family metal-dependent hydrolase
VSERIRVASFNIRTSRGRDGRNRWRRRRETCLAAIRSTSADVIGLQEVRPNQLAHLHRAFPKATIVGADRDGDGRGEHVSVMVAPGRWVVESSETRWLSRTPAQPGSLGWDASLPRVVTLVRLRAGGTLVGVANTHLADKGPEARDRGAALIADWLSREPDRAWVVLGDLNAPPESPPLRRLAEAGFADTLPAAAGGTEHGFTGSTARRRIDFVLTGPGVEVSAAWISYDRPNGRLPSDHWPVVADLVVS